MGSGSSRGGPACPPGAEHMAYGHPYIACVTGALMQMFSLLSASNRPVFRKPFTFLSSPFIGAFSVHAYGRRPAFPKGDLPTNHGDDAADRRRAGADRNRDHRKEIYHSLEGRASKHTSRAIERPPVRFYLKGSLSGFLQVIISLMLGQRTTGHGGAGEVAPTR